MTLESTIEKYLVKRVEALGGVCAKTVRPGRRGWPDRLVAFYGVHLVELKKPKGGRLSVHQVQCHEELDRADVRVWLLYTKAGVDRFIKEIKESYMNP